MVASVAKKGSIVQVIGSTFDVEFDEGHLPAIYNACTVDGDNKGIKIHMTGEVQQHLGGSRVRCVALGSTDGVMRGMVCVDTGAPVQVPVGMETLGRVFNLLGHPIDGRGPITAKEHRSIHANPPKFADLSPKSPRRPRPSSSPPPTNARKDDFLPGCFTWRRREQRAGTVLP